MKRFYSLLITVIAFCFSATAQQRLVLVEEFTNTGCGPCASWSPLLDSCINYRLGECIAIKYHAGYPNRDDEYYLNDRESQQTRLEFYKVSGVPATFIDGQELGTRSFGFLNNAISYCREQPAKYALSVNKTLVDNQLTASVELERLTEDGNDVDVSQLRLFVAVIEEHIVVATPFPNGENELWYTMRKMLTPADGYALTPATDSYRVEWTVEHFDDMSKLGVVAFIQDMETKEILATAYSGPDAEGENRLTLANVYDTPDLICTPNYYGKVILRNDGANTITQAMLNVSVNGTVKQYPWTGSLGYLDRDTVAFDGFTTFQLVSEGKNEVDIWLSDVNGTDTQTNHRTLSFDNSVQITYGVQLKIYTDKKPEEITWKLYDSAGDVVREGGPYDGQARKFITEDLQLTRDDCYLLEFLDAGGDGIIGSAGNGYYQLFQVDENGKTKRITQGDYDSSVYDVFFNLTGTPKAQKRLVLFEEFTNTSCDPCAEFSPTLDRVIADRLGDMVAITYHYNYPSPQDPFYLASSDDVRARAEYYDVTGVPSLRVDGEREGAWGYEEYLDLYVDGYAQEAPEMNIDTRASYDADGQLNVEVSLTNLTPQLSSINPENLRLFVAAVEERVEWDKPAANGERAWNYVLRKMLSGSEGQLIDLSDNVVTPQTFTFSWKPDNLTDFTELGLVTFVLNAAYTPRPTGSDDAVKILEVMNMPDRICTPQFTADLRIRNIGRNKLTSANLNVKINGEVKTTPWMGSVDYLGIVTLRIPTFEGFTLSSSGNNEVELWLSDLNGTTEESVHKHLTFSNAYQAQNAVRLTIMTDQHPEEITWTVINSAGDVVCMGGPYDEPRKKQVIDLPLSIDDCYMLEFEDNGGDGIAEGRGYYMLHEVSAETGKARLLVQATYDEALHDVFFSLQNAAATGIAPQFCDEADETGAYDLLGRRVKSQPKGLIIQNNRKNIRNDQ